MLHLKKITLKSTLFLGALILGSSLCAAHTKELIEGDILSNFRKNAHWNTVSEAKAVGQELVVERADGAQNLLINGEKKGRLQHLITQDTFSDVELKIEFMLPEKSNSGIYFQGRYEIQIYDSYGVEKPGTSDLGAMYHRWHNNVPRNQAAYDGHAPKVNAAKAPGTWQTIHAIFRGPRFNEAGEKIENARFLKVIVNDQVVNENIEATGPTRAHQLKGEAATGPIIIQGDHGPIAIRSLQVTPLSLD